jgi:hypothetical protein
MQEFTQTQKTLTALAEEFAAISEKASGMIRALHNANLDPSPGVAGVLQAQSFNGSAASSALQTALIHMTAVVEAGTDQDRVEAERLYNLVKPLV